MIRVTVWNEYRHEKKNPKIAEIYPQGMHETIASHLRKAGAELPIKTATVDERPHGLSESVVNNRDVFVWWGRMYQEEVSEPIVTRAYNRVRAVAGIAVLH